EPRMRWRHRLVVRTTYSCRTHLRSAAWALIVRRRHRIASRKIGIVGADLPRPSHEFVGERIAAKSERIGLSERIVHVWLCVRSAFDPKRIRGEIARRFRIVIAIPVIVETGLLVVVLAREPDWIRDLPATNLPHHAKHVIPSGPREPAPVAGDLAWSAKMV